MTPALRRILGRFHGGAFQMANMANSPWSWRAGADLNGLKAIGHWLHGSHRLSPSAIPRGRLAVVMSKNVNQVDIGDRKVGPGWRLGLAPRLIRPTAASTFDDNPCTDCQIAPFPTSGRTPVVWMGANDTGAFRPPADNRSSAFHPTASGAGWLQPCQQQAVPGG